MKRNEKLRYGNKKFLLGWVLFLEARIVMIRLILSVKFVGIRGRIEIVELYLWKL